jgi:ABC-2 type transport system permease protein
MDYLRETMAQAFIVSGPIVNAAFLTRYLLNVMVPIFLPLFACAMCGDLVASEASEGTLRMILCRPITRFAIIASKYMIGVLYVILLTIATGLVTYAIGTVFLGRGSLVVVQRIVTQGIWIVPEKVAVLRLMEAYGFVAVGMVALGSICYAISTFVTNSYAATAGGMGFWIMSVILSNIDFFHALRPYLPATYLLDGWRDIFTGTTDPHTITHALIVMLTYSVVSFMTGAIIFHRRDILS